MAHPSAECPTFPVPRAWHSLCCGCPQKHTMCPSTLLDPGAWWPEQGTGDAISCARMCWEMLAQLPWSHCWCICPRCISHSWFSLRKNTGGPGPGLERWPSGAGGWWQTGRVMRTAQLIPALNPFFVSCPCLCPAQRDCLCVWAGKCPAQKGRAQGLSLLAALFVHTVDPARCLWCPRAPE